MDILAWRFTERGEPGEGLSENSVQTDLRGFLLKAGQGDDVSPGRESRGEEFDEISRVGESS